MQQQLTPLTPFNRRINMKTTLQLTTALAVSALMAGAAHAATVIYQDDFIGHADVDTDGLNGETPDIGASNWVAAPTYGADGSIANGAGASAALDFTPVDGFVYTLDASFRNFANVGTVNPDNDWVALGFATGTSTGTGNLARFTDGSTPQGVAWILMRGNTTANVNNVAWLGSATDGTPTGGNTTWSGSEADDYGADLDLRVVLDTTGGTGNWTATWFAKTAAAGTYTEVAAEADLLTEGITSVAIARGGEGFTADVTAFSLTAVPEPGSLALLGLGSLLIGARRRRG